MKNVARADDRQAQVLMRLVQDGATRMTARADAGHDDANGDFDDRPVAVPPRPDVLAAAFLLGRAATAAGVGLAETVSRPATYVVRVPAASWVRPVGDAFRICAFGSADAGRDGDAGGGSGWSAPRSGPLVFLRDGTGKDHRPDVGNDAVGDAVQAGRTVVGIAPDPGRSLPADLLRACDVRLDVGTLDPTAIARVVASVTGTTPRTRVGAASARLCDPNDLRLAVTGRRGPDGSTAALRRILAAKVPTRSGPRLEDLSGYEEAKVWGLALVEDLRRWRAGGIPFSDCESSILLSGPPGVGKTQFAAALARSAGLPLLAGSLGQWQAARDGHLGHTLGAMRAFFDRARYAPCVVLIDEIDSFGDRSRFPADHRDYSTQVVNALLELLDGAAGREGIVVVAATNNPDAVDPAIRRPGRLDRHVRIGLPGVDALRGILRTCLGRTLPRADLTPAAVEARGMSGADIAAAVRRAAGSARRAGRRMSMADLMAAVAGGRGPVPVHVRLRTAIHEAGHGLALLRLRSAGRIELSLHAGGGITEAFGDIDLYDQTERSIENFLTVVLAGRAAEEEALGDVSAGAVSDLASATQVAALMEVRWGFSRKHSLVSLGDGDVVDVARMPWLAGPIQERLQAAYDRARGLMRNDYSALGRLAEALFHEGFLDDARVRRLVGGPDRPDGGTPDTAARSGRFA